jgi:hypothetical protein
MQDTIRKQFGSEEHPFTRLVPDLSGLRRRTAALQRKSAGKRSLLI